MTGKWRGRLEVLRDTVADAKHAATEPIVRCKGKKDGKQCQLNRHGKGVKHEHGTQKW